MDWLSKRNFVIVSHEEVVRIPLEGDETLQVHGERTQGVMKTLMNTKVEFRIDLVHGATSVAKSPYRLAPLEMQELEAWSPFEVSVGITEEGEVVTYLRFIENFSKIVKPSTSITERDQKYKWGTERKEKGRVKLRRVRAMSMTIQSSVKDKILATPKETSKVENTPAEMLRDLDQQMEKRADDGCTLWIKLYSKYEYEIRYHPGKANVVIKALRRKERVKPRRLRAMAMNIQYVVRGTILAAQSEAFKQENVLAEILHGLDQQMERKGDESLYFMDRI
ncbi:hypothetical protein Tco_1215353 [Tanacetum coccineum]